MKHSTKAVKPQKPRPDFPLYAHASRKWAKKIRGKLHYFGRWEDPQAALNEYLDQKEDLHAGRTPRVQRDGLTVRDLCNRFLTSKRHLLDTGEIVQRTFRTYHESCRNLVDAIDKNRIVDDLYADDFEHIRRALSKKRGPVSLGNEIGRIRSVFKYAYDQGLIEKPIRYGQGFRKPSAKTLRKQRAANGKRMFEVDELRTIIAAASQPMKAFALLGINCGFGQSDIANLTTEIVKNAIKTGWIEFARIKTGVERRCPLWPETRDAVQEAMGMRPDPGDAADANLAFLTPVGMRWVRDDCDAICCKFTKLLKDQDLKRPRISFYAIRHTFETIAGGSKDQVAVNAIMGHVDNTMAGAYRERIDDERLQAVVGVVHDWIFGK